MAEKLANLSKSGGGTFEIDYANPVSISTSGQAAPVSGLLVVGVNATSGYGSIVINNDTIASIQTFGNYGGYINCMVCKGDLISFDTYGTSITGAKIYPFK